PAAILGLQIGRGVGRADEGERDFHRDGAGGSGSAVGVEADVGAATAARTGSASGVDAGSGPGAVSGEGMLELGHEVDRVVVARPTELAAGYLSLHFVVAEDADLVGRDRV